MSTGLFYTGSKIVFWEQDDFAMHRSYYSSSNPLIGTGSFTGSVIYFGTWSSGSSAGPSHVVTSSSAHLMVHHLYFMLHIQTQSYNGN